MNGTPEPALTPIHPDKPEPAIVKSDIWVKIATGKTSVNAPTCQILGYEPSVPGRKLLPRVRYRRLDYRLTDSVSEPAFRRDWRPC